MPKSHAQGSHRGLNAAADGAFGRFGRMFADLTGPEFDPKQLAKLAATMIKVDDGQFFNESDDDENKLIPAGYTYFGQFVDHDLTLDKTSIGAQENDPAAISDFRTAALDLDNVYGNGPGSSVQLYDQATFKLKLGQATLAPAHPGAVQTIHDHLRDGTQTAQIGDPRNDENVIVAQLHQSFVRFHNKVVDTPALMAGVTDKGDAFRRAARLTRWHYQWVVVHDFLKRITHPAIYQDIAGDPAHPRLRYYPKLATTATWPYLPIEFLRRRLSVRSLDGAPLLHPQFGDRGRSAERPRRHQAHPHLRRPAEVSRQEGLARLPPDPRGLGHRLGLFLSARRPCRARAGASEGQRHAAAGLSHRHAAGRPAPETVGSGPYQPARPTAQPAPISTCSADRCCACRPPNRSRRR